MSLGRALTADTQEDFSLVRIVMLGNSNCGKTSILRRWEGGPHTEQTPTNGIDIVSRNVTVTVGNTPITARVHAWDTSGRQCHTPVCKSFIYNASVVILCYDVNDPDATDSLTRWKAVADSALKHRAQFVVAACKSDTRPCRCVAQDGFHCMPCTNAPLSHGAVFARLQAMPFFLTSARYNDNVSALFHAATYNALQAVADHPWPPFAVRLCPRDAATLGARLQTPPSPKKRARSRSCCLF
jgi:small GTP-binding protein